MRDSLSQAQNFRLADWCVTPAAGLLQCGQVTRRVPPRLMRLLLVLASRSQEVVSKQEIIDRVWDNQDASDDSLSASVYQLRKVLGDESLAPRYIETIPKRGYRMLVDAQFAHAERNSPAAKPYPVASALSGVPADALEAFSRGQALLATHRSTSLRQAKLYFEHALALEPRFAAAHASLACAHVALLYNQPIGMPWAEHARCNARAALEIDPSLGWAHAARALVFGFVDGDLPAADAAYRVALELRPDLVVSRRRYALLLAAMQRSDEALHQLTEATRHDPFNVSAQHEIAHIFFMLRCFDRSAEELLKVLAREPRSWSAYGKLAFIHWIRGNPREVHATYRAAASACDTPPLLQRIDRAFSSAGVAGLYAAIACHLEASSPERRYHVAELIATHAAAGNHARALELMECAWAQGSPHMFWLYRSPFVDALRTEAAFQALAVRYDNPDSVVNRPRAR